MIPEESDRARPIWKVVRSLHGGPGLQILTQSSYVKKVLGETPPSVHVSLVCLAGSLVSDAGPSTNDPSFGLNTAKE